MRSRASKKPNELRGWGLISSASCLEELSPCKRARSTSRSQLDRRDAYVAVSETLGGPLSRDLRGSHRLYLFPAPESRRAELDPSVGPGSPPDPHRPRPILTATQRLPPAVEPTQRVDTVADGPQIDQLIPAAQRTVAFQTELTLTAAPAGEATAAALSADTTTSRPTATASTAIATNTSSSISR